MRLFHRDRSGRELQFLPQQRSRDGRSRAARGQRRPPHQRASAPVTVTRYLTNMEPQVEARFTFTRKLPGLPVCRDGGGGAEGAARCSCWWGASGGRRRQGAGGGARAGTAAPHHGDAELLDGVADELAALLAEHLVEVGVADGGGGERDGPAHRGGGRALHLLQRADRSRVHAVVAGRRGTRAA